MPGVEESKEWQTIGMYFYLPSCHSETDLELRLRQKESMNIRREERFPTCPKKSGVVKASRVSRLLDSTRPTGKTLTGPRGTTSHGMYPDSLFLSFIQDIA